MSDDGEATVVSAFASGDPLPPWCTPAWDVLAARAAGNSLPHALLVCGPAGLGKRVLTEAFVRARLCESLRDGRACGHCRACRLLAAGTHPDRVLVTFEENPKTHKLRTEIVIDQIRALSARLAMASQLGGWQVAVIDPAEAMNPASQNALLKTLEEPTASSLIVLVADQPSRLSATVRSRCQRVEIALPPKVEALAWLGVRGVEHAEAALAAAGGNPGLAWLLAEHGGMQRRQEVARDLLALAAGRGDARAIGRAWADDEPGQRLEQAARLLEGALRARAEGLRARFDPGWDDATLAARCAGANHLRRLLDGPLRGDLALFDWLNGLPRTQG
ncbi:MAG: DNA polymerase III delta prime subunit [Rhodanobacteraceae bacterium]|jgi:DNA polymerase-3 subunit delta'|nr:MAG: DNA polymerase III delta prime subunit [Rhodanobacteraceae bacterium]